MLWRCVSRVHFAKHTYKNITRIANTVQYHSQLSGHKDFHTFRFSIVRIVTSASNVASLLKCPQVVKIEQIVNKFQTNSKIHKLSKSQNLIGIESSTPFLIKQCQCTSFMNLKDIEPTVFEYIIWIHQTLESILAGTNSGIVGRAIRASISQILFTEPIHQTSTESAFYGKWS